MSNPTVTKFMTMVKGIFGRKESVPATGSDTVAEPAVEKAEAATANATVETPEASETANASEAAETSTAAPAEEKPAEAEAEKPAETTETTTGKPQPEAPAAEKAEPADAEEIAEEIAVAEADTAVSSDDVLEKVRKGNAPSADELAVPTYDELTLPSVRARLRKLTIDQVRDLRAYEVAHQGRSDFIKMYDNRIAKLETAE
ncbi:hypothetical protein [Nocardiopsis sp. CNT312]|uniref:hypothetical protein n=1 Tax=Nocardiopsis sp. CNT312 TaxID=1137268 RepID=UPI00048B6559|nr:hypothetical protein [Nocardiopsis sp. CNT312]